MKDLKSIWNHTSGTQNKGVDEENNQSNFEYIFLKFEREENTRKKYTFFTIIFVMLIIFGFYHIVTAGQQNMNVTQFLGLFLISISSAIVVFFSQLIKISVKEFNYQKSSVDFLLLVKTKLSKRRLYFIIGICLHLVLLLFGLHLLIFTKDFANNFGELIGLYYGSLLAVAAGIIGLLISFYDAYYKNILRRINDVVKE